MRLAAADTGDVEPAIRRSEEIHREVWTEAVQSIEKMPSSIAGGLFVQALNDVIDLHAKRVMIAVRSRIPGTIWIALYAIAFSAVATLGLYVGFAGAGRSIAVVMVAVAFSAVIALIRDLDSTTQGALRVSQQTMRDLQESMSPP